jgi:hypothetical protein
MPDCAVCYAHPSRYRCPGCRTRYCAVACYKAHTCCPPEPRPPSEDEDSRPFDLNL